jgi:hypothetical protein
MNLVRGICAPAKMNFAPTPLDQIQISDGRGPMHRSTKQRFSLICDQTNNREQTNKDCRDRWI